MALSILDRVDLAFAGLVDGLCDPKRWRRFTLLVVCVYAAAWTLYGVIAKSSQDINADMAEMVVWAREPALGYPKHPPLLAYVLKLWFSVFPLADWAYILLAVITVSAGIYLATELCGLWLQGEKRAATPFLLAVIPFYNFFGLKFDQNSALIPLWALTIWAFMRSLETRRAGWSALMGLAAAAAMLTKYWSVFLLAALAAAVLLDRRRNDYLRSRAPWIAAIVFLLAVLPHVVWLIVEHFPPMQYVAARRGTSSVASFLDSLTEYSVGTLGYAAPALALTVVLFRPSLPVARDSWFAIEPARRPATLLFWTPLLLPIAVSSVTRTNLLSLWNEPALNLLPVMILASPLVLVSRAAVRRLAAIVTALTLFIVAASPFVALAIFKIGAENDVLSPLLGLTIRAKNDTAYTRLAAAAIEREWRATSNAPLRLVAGPFTLVSSAAFYITDKPSIFADFSDYLSPWATAPRIAHDGIAIVCPADDKLCLDNMTKLTLGGPPGRLTEVTLTRYWLGLANAPKRFVIATVPPRP